MIETTKDLAWKDEIPQQFTSAEMTEIKNAVSQETVNVNITPYHIYSPNERQVGEWQQTIDGVLKKRPVYEKNVEFAQAKTISNSSATSVGISSTGYSTILKAQGCVKYSGETAKTMGGSLIPVISSGEIKFLASRDGEVLEIDFIVMEYTKITDEWENV